MQPTRPFAIDLAKKAAEYLLKNFRKDAYIAKQRGLAKEVVTRYDKESDAIIVAAIEKAYPKHSYLTEETGFVNKKSEYTWIVDSLDGTGNFAMGNPLFAVSIALKKGDAIVLAVVYAPFLAELYTAERGKGAFLNGKYIHVSDVSELSQAYIVACEGGAKNTNQLANLYGTLYPQVKDMRKLGSAAIEGCFVAAGRVEAYVTFTIPSYDVAACALIVQEAGGKTTDFAGKQWKCKQSDIIFSNGKVHDEILKAVKK